MEWPFEGDPTGEERAHWDAFVRFYREQFGRSPTPEDVEHILESEGESLFLELVAKGRAEFFGVDETGATTFLLEDERDGPPS